MWRKIAPIVVLGLLCSCAATAGELNMHCTAPTSDNDGGTCDAPSLVSRAATDSLWIHFRWRGPSSGEDSLWVAPGASVSLLRTVPVGNYVVAAWPSDRNGIGCVSSIQKAVLLKPWKVGGLQ